MRLDTINKLLTKQDYLSQEEVTDDLESVKSAIIDSIIKTKSVIEYCEPYLQYTWAAQICGKVLGCDFRDVKDHIKSFYKYCEEKGI